MALPLALGLTALTSGGARPSVPGLDGAPVVLATGQLLGLPVVATLVRTERRSSGTTAGCDVGAGRVCSVVGVVLLGGAAVALLH